MKKLLLVIFGLVLSCNVVFAESLDFINAVEGGKVITHFEEYAKFKMISIRNSDENIGEDIIVLASEDGMIDEVYKSYNGTYGMIIKQNK